MARSVARGTAWVRQRARAGHGPADAGYLRLEGAVDLRRRICVATEAVVPAARTTRFAAVRPLPARAPDALAPVAGSRRVVYAGGSRYVAGAGRWVRVAGGIEGPRRPSDPVWLLDALRHAVDCVDTGSGEVGGRLDLSGAQEVDRSGILPTTGRASVVRRREQREREDWLARVPYVVAVDADGTIASMSFAALPPSRDGGLLWATTEFVEYGVPVEVPDLLARVPAAAARGATGPALPCLTRSSGR